MPRVEHRYIRPGDLIVENIEVALNRNEAIALASLLQVALKQDE